MMRRLLAGAVVLALAGCGGPPPAPLVFAPLNYNYLPPIILKVSSVAVVNQYVPDPDAAGLLGQAPETPADALTAMLNHRLVASGTPGVATATIEAASVEPVGGNYVGTMTVRLDVQSADGHSSGYTQATVTHTQTAPDNDSNDVQTALYGMTKSLMDAMNVSLQYQIQQNLGSWVSYSSNAAVAPVGTAGSGLGSGIMATPLTAPPAPPDTAPVPLPLPGMPPVPQLTLPPSLTPTAIPPATGLQQ